LPHSEIFGSKFVRNSPKLIAAYHVLHRLSVPRHPPNALKTLDRSHHPCSPAAPPRRTFVPRSRPVDHTTDKTILLHIQPDSTRCPSRSPTTRPRPTAGRRAARACCRLNVLFTMSNNKPGSRPPQGAATRQNLSPDAPPPAHKMVEPDGIEPTTSCLQSTRSPN
jgi:hypothetical protein